MKTPETAAARNENDDHAQIAFPQRGGAVSFRVSQNTVEDPR